MVRHLVLVLTLSVLIACGADGETSATPDTYGDVATVADGEPAGTVTTPDLAGLTDPCSADADCVFACTADYCGGCKCDGVGILASQQAELESRKAALAAGCQSEISCAVWPPPPSAVCATDGTCRARMSASTEGLLACTEDTDCTVSTTKFVCSLCPCGGTAVGTAHLDTYLERVEDMLFYCPTPTQEDIDACAGSGECAPGTATCEDGLCDRGS
jgi:hypothetical protein